MASTSNRAVKADALGEGVPFQFDGEDYVVLPPSEWDVDALEAFEGGKVVTCVRLILGDAQYKRFKAKPRKVADLNQMFQDIQNAVLGGGAGN